MKAFFRPLIAALLAVSGMVHAEVAVIVNAAAGVNPSRSEVANVFLGKDKSLTGVDQKAWTPAKDTFYTVVTYKNESQLNAYWSSLIFTGKGQPLATVEDDAAVVARVAADEKAIGYVDSAAVTEQVRVLFTVP